MNRSAVALAADSAVSFDSHIGIKTYDTANKLFELIKGSNIGVMIYNSAEINSTPWESVIKSYRNENPKFSAAHVGDYANHFLDFIAAHDGLIEPADEVITARMMARNQILDNVLETLFDWPDRLVSDTGRIIKVRVKTALNTIISQWKSELEKLEEVNINDATKKALRSSFFELIVDLARELLDDNDIPHMPGQLRGIAECVLLSFFKKVSQPFDTGLVFAGFGTADYFPSMASARVSARFCKTALTYNDEIVQISSQERGYWDTFAVDGPAKGWANGIHDQMRTEIIQKWTHWIRYSLGAQVRGAIKEEGLSSAQVTSIAKKVTELARKQYNDFSTHMQDIEYSQFRMPMTASIEVLPKDELAVLAESLVNLTSLRHHMTIDQQNIVGGPIDVALISIGDGFVWLKRKHYFDNTLNPTWHLTHGASIRTRVTTAGEGNGS